MKSPSRRIFLKTAGATGLAITSSLASAKVMNQPVAGERKLRLYNLHTGESLSATYWADGEYVDQELAAIDHVLRDHRADESVHMDHALLDQINTLQQHLGHSGTIEIISGYRSPATNAMLRRSSSGVAKKSFHMMGRAIDLRMPGVKLKDLRKAALKLRAGGVGYYPNSNFVHLDTGRPRFW